MKSWKSAPVIVHGSHPGKIKRNKKEQKEPAAVVAPQNVPLNFLFC